MCGIAGYVGPYIGPDGPIRKMGQAIEYRGRDARGAWDSGEGAAFFHTRLSIIDLADGDQPMMDHTERWVIVFNGEIYNFVELREEYGEQGASFRTRSDTEIILEGFKLKGEKVCDDLNGMFAFAIWDREREELFVARDRLGKKPLYWCLLHDVFFFSSTLDSFCELPGWSGEISKPNIRFYSAVGSFPTGKTIYKDAFSLPPGTHARLDKKCVNPRLKQYWAVDFSKKRNISEDEALQEIESLLQNAIEIRLRSDVPVCLTFSGGVDSGLIGAMVAQMGQKISCWTIDYHDESDQSEEVKIAESVAALLELPWFFENFDYKSLFVSAIEAAMAEVDQPCNNPSIGYSRILYERIGLHAKVVLTGNGADELFLGYAGNEELLQREEAWERENRSLLRDMIGRIVPSLSRRKNRTASLAAYQCEYVTAMLNAEPQEDNQEDNSAEEVEEIVEKLRAELVRANVSCEADLYTFMALRYYTCDTNFRIPDIAGLSAQVEVRSPFLDFRIVEFAASLPTGLKIASAQSSEKNKYLLKRLYERYVSNDIAWARKKGMGANLRYDESIIRDQRILSLYDELLALIGARGLSREVYQQAWDSYIREKRAGIRYPGTSGVAMSGFMLGLWLKRRAKH